MRRIWAFRPYTELGGRIGWIDDAEDDLADDLLAKGLVQDGSESALTLKDVEYGPVRSAYETAQIPRERIATTELTPPSPRRSRGR